MFGEEIHECLTKRVCLDGIDISELKEMTRFWYCAKLERLFKIWLRGVPDIRPEHVGESVGIE